jgi:type II secretion system protein E
MGRPLGQSLQDLLSVSGFLTEEQLQHALRESERTGSKLQTAVVRLGYASEEKVLQFLAERLGLQYVRDVERLLNPEVLLKVPSEFALRHQVLPLQQEDGVLVVATADPLNVSALDDLRLLVNGEIRPVLAPSSEISEAIEQFYMERIFRDMAELQADDVAAEELEVSDLQKMASEALVIKLVNLILHQAIQDRASDVHIEPFENHTRVRYRIDGVLHDASSPPKRLHPAIVSRVKILADMNIAERRLPQDGRIRLRFSGRQIDMRVSTVPTLFGEGVVIRLLDKSIGLMALEDLGMPPGALAQFASVIRKPHGIILVTGPTGSGKTTTLYAALSRIISPERKVITIEDPVEYQLPGANQINVRPNIGLTFATGLRHIVRQDPDIIMVGEIRDRETADIAIHAALTGHLVFSTLHTNDSAGAVTRLLDMGIEPYLVASSVIAVLAQRLVRVICLDCKQAAALEDEALAELGVDPELRASFTACQGRGCDRCRSTGYMGRIGVFELLPINDEVRSQVLEKAAASQIKQGALARGMRTLLADGREKVSQGRTTVEEVLHVCQRDEL